MANNAEIIAAIEKMTILELADLVKEMEEKFRGRRCGRRRGRCG